MWQMMLAAASVLVMTIVVCVFWEAGREDTEDRVLLWFRKNFFQIRGMWTAAGVIFESQRNVLNMTIELAREVERRIKLKREVERLQKGIIDIADKADAHGHIGVRAECNALLIEEK